MSSVGQAVGGVIGAVIGFVATGGNPLGAIKGFSIGASIGGMISPPKGPNIVGPRLTDLTVQTSTYGADIPRVYGTIATNGNVFWLQGNQITEVAKKSRQGGKGGGGSKVTTFTYFATFAVGLCQTQISGVRRIWVGSKLIYDAGSDDIETIIASNEAATGFRIYKGTETQTADPRMQADLGVNFTPAFRGLAYIVFYDYPLQDHGNSLAGAQVKVEVVEDAGFVPSTALGTMANADRRSMTHNGNVFCSVAGALAYVSRDGINWETYPLPVSRTWTGITSNGSYMCAVATGSTTSIVSADNGITWTQGTLPSSSNWNDVTYGGNVFVAVSYNSAGACAVSLDGLAWVATTLPAPYVSWLKVTHNGTVFCALEDGTVVATSTDGAAWTVYSLPATRSWTDIGANGSILCAIAEDTIFNAVSTDDGVTWVQHSMSSQQVWKSICSSGGRFFATQSFSPNPSSTSAISDDGVTWTAVDLGLASNWFASAGGNGIFCTVTQFSTHSAILLPDVIVPDLINLGDIVKEEMLLSNLLLTSDIDTTSLTSFVRGYKVSGTGAVRGALEALQGAWPFDIIQSGYQIKCVSRGTSSVVTIPSTKLDARDAGAAAGVQLTNSREMDSTLPKRVSIKYLDVNREYDQGEQYAERISTESINSLQLEMPIALTATEAAQKAEVLLYMYWLERYDVSFKITEEYNYLEPADVLTVTTEDASYELRLTGITYTEDGALVCTAKYNNVATYTSTAVGEEGQNTGQTITFAGPAVYQLMDIPLVDENYDAGGFPLAMTGQFTNWPGGILYRSDDDGQVWESIQGVAGPGSVMGYALSTLTAHSGILMDKTSVLSLRLFSGELSSVTQIQMFAGANYFAYGADGRWEIIAAQNAVLQADGSYKLTDLLRGRFGTEWATGLHQVTDNVVLLSVDNLDFVSTNINSIGLERSWIAVTFGKGLDSDTSYDFTYRGVNLECLSPVYAKGSASVTTLDWTISWIRRTRVGGEWRDLVDASLGETTQAYEIDVFSSVAYTTLKRTLTSSIPTVTYTSADQVTDFGSNQTTLYLKIYQMSSTVGRGYPLTVALTT